MLNAHYPHLKNSFNFTREGLNRAGPFTGPNEFGLFLAKFQTECPYSGERRRVSYFFRQVNGKHPADPVLSLDIRNDELSNSNLLQRDCMRLGRGGGDPPSDGYTTVKGGGDPPSDVNTLERRGGDPPSDGNTLEERTPSNQHNDLGEVITPCRDKPDAGLDMIYLSIGKLQRQLSFLVLIIRTEKEMMSLMD